MWTPKKSQPLFKRRNLRDDVENLGRRLRDIKGIGWSLKPIPKPKPKPRTDNSSASSMNKSISILYFQQKKYE